MPVSSKAFQTAADRFRLLLRWLNEPPADLRVGESADPWFEHVRPDYERARHTIDVFIASFDGSVGAAHVLAQATDAEWEIADEKIDELHAALRMLLEQGFDTLHGDVRHGEIGVHSLLSFKVRNAGRQKPAAHGSRVVGGEVARRRYREAGAYVRVACGSAEDLLTYLFTLLLTTPDAVAIKRCQRGGCHRFVVESPGPGAPRKFCSDFCRDVNGAVRQRERQRKKKKKKTLNEEMKGRT